METMIVQGVLPTTRDVALERSTHQMDAASRAADDRIDRASGQTGTGRVREWYLQIFGIDVGADPADCGSCVQETSGRELPL